MLTVRDPGLEDMLSEPMIVKLMASDRVSAEEARALFADIAKRLQNREFQPVDERDPGRRSASKGIVYA